MHPSLRTQLLRPTTFNTIKLFSSLQLPPSLRTRFFHATPRPQFYEPVVYSAHAILESIHSASGLPWAYSIPLSALIIRLTLVLPIGIYSRRCLQKQASLTDILSSWQHPLRKDATAEAGHLGPIATHKPYLKKLRKKRVELYKRWECQTWKIVGLPLLQLPVFLVFIEAIRKMCGTSQGLFGLAASSIGKWFSGNNLPTSIADVESSTLVTEQLIPKDVLLDPSLATEGALWFPNLLIADPQLILPFMLSGAIFMNLYGKLPGAGPEPKASSWQARFKRSMGVVALAVGPLTLSIPSGMLVYWISSTSLAYLQAVALQIAMPLKKPIVPCQPKWTKKAPTNHPFS